jgi:hypothetical protein
VVVLVIGELALLLSFCCSRGNEGFVIPMK